MTCSPGSTKSLAATVGATYGVYGPTFETFEAAPVRPHSEEYLDSEKYQLRHWDWERPNVFREFVALYLELKYFARHLLSRYFPAIDDADRVEAVLAEVVDADALFAATRPAGAPDPTVHKVHEDEAYQVYRLTPIRGKD